MITTSPSEVHATAAPLFACDPVTLDFLTTTAPYRFVTCVDLRVTPRALFAVLEDESSWPRWARPGIRRVTWTSPRPFGVGATRTVSMLGGLEVFEKFFVWQRDEELAFHLTGATQDVWTAFAERYEVTPTAPGNCRLTWTVAYAPSASFARVQPIVRPLLRLAFRFYLRNLARYVRGRADGS